MEIDEENRAPPPPQNEAPVENPRTIFTPRDPMDFPPARMTGCVRLPLMRAILPGIRPEELVLENVLVVEEDDDVVEEDGGGRQDDVLIVVENQNIQGDEGIVDVEEHAIETFNEEQRQFVRNHHHNARNPSTVGTEASELASLDRVTRRGNRAYALVKRLRRCIYGFVYQAVELIDRADASSDDEVQWQLSGRMCAVKEMSWALIREHLLEENFPELPIKETSTMQYIMSLPDNTSGDKMHVMGLWDTLYDERNLYTVMPFCNGGEMFDKLDTHGLFNENEARSCVTEMLKGLRFLQDVGGISHRDVSLENFMLHHGSVIIMDFGMSLRVPHALDHGHRRYTLMPPQGNVGKAYYKSPEVCANVAYLDGFKCDMWAIGVILIMLLTGEAPFERATRADRNYVFIRQHRETGVRRLFEALAEMKGVRLSRQVVDFVSKILKINPHDRMGVHQALRHPWINTVPQDLPRDRNIQRPWMS